MIRQNAAYVDRAICEYRLSRKSQYIAQPLEPQGHLPVVIAKPEDHSALHLRPQHIFATHKCLLFRLGFCH